MNMPTDNFEGKQPEQSCTSKRYFRARHALHLFRKHRRQVLLACVILVFVIVGAAVTQHWFVHVQLYRTTKQELGSWGAQVTREIAYKDKWDLTGYRRASISAPSWYVVTKDGLIVDIEG